MSGMRDVWTMSGYGSRFLYRSAWSVQSLASCRMRYFFVLMVGTIVVPSLTNGMTVMPVLSVGCFFFCSSSNLWNCSLETISWRHRYLL